MSGSSVMFTKDWMVNDCSSHYLQGQSIKRTVSEQVGITFREFLPNKTAVCTWEWSLPSGVSSQGVSSQEECKEGGGNEEITHLHTDLELSRFNRDSAFGGRPGTNKF